MKNSITLLTTLICLWFLTINLKRTNNIRSTPIDPNLCLEIDGKIVYEKSESKSDCKIVLVCSNSTSDSLVLAKGKSKFKLLLKKNLFYSLKISKPGFVTKLICIDTEMPLEEIGSGGLYKFKFSTKLIKNEVSKKLNKEALDFPIAIISYNDKQARFYYDKKYTSSIKKQINYKKSI